MVKKSANIIVLLWEFLLAQLGYNNSCTDPSSPSPTKPTDPTSPSPTKSADPTSLPPTGPGQPLSGSSPATADGSGGGMAFAVGPGARATAKNGGIAIAVCGGVAVAAGAGSVAVAIGAISAGPALMVGWLFVSAVGAGIKLIAKSTFLITDFNVTRGKRY